MEEQSDFIWQLIEQVPVLKQKIKNLDSEKFEDSDKQVTEYIDFFRDIEFMLEEIKSNFLLPNTKLLVTLNSKP